MEDQSHSRPLVNYAKRTEHRFVDRMVCSERKDLFVKQIKALYPADFKNAVEIYFNRLLEPIRQEFNSDEKRDLVQKAYPPMTSKGKQLAFH